MHYLKTIAAGAVFLAITGSYAHAADLAPPLGTVSDPASQLSELGTGWYLRGDAAWTREDGYIVNSLGDILTASEKNGWMADIGGGYQFNQWLRLDATLEFRNSIRKNYTGPNELCPDGANPQTDPVTGRAIASLTNYDQCVGTFRNRESRAALLFNGYVDLGTWYSVTPYVGAGVGTARIQTVSTTYYNFLNGDHYNVTWTDPYNSVTYHGYRDKNLKTTKYNFAWAAMAGVAVDVAPHTKLDVGYRYADFGTIHGVNPDTGASTSKKITSHEIRAGIRYLID